MSLMKGEKGNFAKMIFISCVQVISTNINSKLLEGCHLGKGMGLQVPCELLFTGRDIPVLINKLKNSLS